MSKDVKTEYRNLYNNFESGEFGDLSPYIVSQKKHIKDLKKLKELTEEIVERPVIPGEVLPTMEQVEAMKILLKKIQEREEE